MVKLHATPDAVEPKQPTPIPPCGHRSLHSETQLAVNTQSKGWHPSIETHKLNCANKTKDCPVAKDAHLIVYPTPPPLLLLQKNIDPTKQRSECHVPTNLTNAPEKDKHICCVSVYELPKAINADLAASPSRPYPKETPNSKRSL